MKKIVYFLIEWLPLFLISLVPLLWFVPGHLINPNDTNFPLNPLALFKQRFFTWNDQHGVGINFSFDTAGISFHGLQALIYSLGFSVIDTEKIFLCFWFFLIAASFYLFLKSFLGERKNKIIYLAGTIFYLFNPYLFNIFSNINAANLAALFFIPVSTKLLLGLISGQTSLKRFLLTFPFVCFISAPMGINFPVLAVVLFYLIFLFISLSWYYRKPKLKKVFLTFVLFLFLFFVFNAYWLLPDIAVLTQKNAFNFPSGTELKTLLGGFSEFNGLNNLFRLQGDWVWRYEGFRGEKFVTYADKFINNPFLIAVSFISPILFVLSLIFVKRKFLIVAGVLLIVSLIFSSGSHLPLGSIFLFLTQRLSIFSIFRSPWYKFSILTVFAYALSASLFLSYLLSRKTNWGIWTVIFLTAGQLIYGHPLLTREIFPEKRMFLPPAQFVVPDYPSQTAEFFNNIKGDFVAMSLPTNPADVYSWGFNAPYDLLNLYAPSKGVLAGPAQNNTNGLYEVLYQGLITGYPDLTKQMNFLNSRYLIHKKDIVYDFYYNYDEPRLIENLLERQKNITKTINFGPWDLYEALVPSTGIISLTQQSDQVYGGKENLPQIITLPEFDENKLTIFAQSKLSEDLETSRSFWPMKLMPKRVANIYPYTFPSIKHSPTSPFYFLVRLKEDRQLGQMLPLSADYLQFKLQLTGKRIQELKLLFGENNSSPKINQIQNEIVNDIRFIKNFLFSGKIRIQDQPYFLNICLSALETFLSYLSENNLTAINGNQQITEIETLKENLSNYLKDDLSNQEFLRFQINLPEEGFYDFYLLRLENSQNFFSEKVELEIDGQKKDLISVADSSGWLKIEKINLSQGNHVLGLPINFLEKFSEFLGWELINVSKKGKELILDANQGIATASVKIKKLDNINPTVVDFEYNALPGSEFKIEEYQVNKKDYQTKIQPGIIQNLGAYGWENFSFDFQTDFKTDYLLFSLTLKPMEGEGINNLAQIKNLRIYTKPKLPVMVKKENLPPVEWPKLNWSFFKQDPTQYRVIVKNSKGTTFLIFRQTYNPLWRAYIGKNELTHFEQSGYFNGWLFDQPGNFEIIIKYQPQEKFLLGTKLAIFGLVFSYLGLFLRKDERK